MRDPMNYVERFCYKHPNFGIKNLMLYITIGNVAFWIMGAINPVLMTYLTFSPYHILHGQVWRLVTFMLYPPSTGILAFIAFYFYYWIGSTLEQYWGTGQFTIYFFTGVILTAIYGFAVYFIRGISLELTATYIYLSMFFSFAALFPDMQVLLFYCIPIKIKYLAFLDAALFVVAVITTSFPLNLLPVVAVLNFFIFCGGQLWSKRPRRSSKNTVNFRRESQRIRRQQEQDHPMTEPHERGAQKILFERGEEIPYHRAFAIPMELHGSRHKGGAGRAEGDNGDRAQYPEQTEEKLVCHFIHELPERGIYIK